MMINKRLIGTVSQSKKYVAGNVALQWCSLAANIIMMTGITGLLASLYAGTADESGILSAAAVAVLAVGVRFACTVGASRMGYLSSKAVKRILREKIYRKLLRLGTSYREQVKTSEVVQVAVEGVDQLNSITIMDLIAYGGAALGVIMAVTQFRAGNLSLAGCLLIILLAADFFIPMRQLGSFFHIAMNGMAASDKIFRLLDLPEPELKTMKVPEDCAIVCDQLCFSYEGNRSSFCESVDDLAYENASDSAKESEVQMSQQETRRNKIPEKREVLHRVHMEFPKGSFTSIVGESGCGKSTLAAILIGRNRGYGGSVKIGGVELSIISEESLMENFTYISHQSYLFKGTVRENLLMGKPATSDGELWTVLARVKLADFLKGESGLDTVLAEKASNFSGGQCQRLALARALLHDSPIYIFDEATSNIDLESENDIMEEIHRLAGTKTVILISHRLANVTVSDNIYVLEQGRVTETGNHEKLLSGGDGMELRAGSGELSSFILDSLRGLPEMIQYRQGEKRLEEMNARTDALSADEKRMKHRAGCSTAAANTAILLFDLAMLFVSAMLCRAGGVDFSGVLIPTIALFSSFGPVIALANLGSTLQHTFAAGNRVLDILEETPVTEEIRDGVTVDFVGAQAENITFSYENEKILDGLSLEFAPHKITGIVGKSGSGKSTLLKLLMRFWKTDGGEIRVSDTDIERINTACLRDLESFVTQETHLFHDSIRNNLRIAKLDATDGEIEAACKKASVHDFIMGLPQGYDTPVGELGDTLSGGERQRLGLARAFLHNAPFLLLDEPTSNLDSLNEAVILKSLREEREDSGAGVPPPIHPADRRRGVYGWTTDPILLSGGRGPCVGWEDSFCRSPEDFQPSSGRDKEKKRRLESRDEN